MSKKVTIIARGIANGGSGRVSAMIANDLAQAGYQVQYLALVYPGKDYDLQESIRYAFVGYRERVPLQALRKSLNVLESLRQFQPDVVISFLVKPVFLSSLLLKVPFIYSPRNDPNTVDNGAILRRIRNIEYKRAKAIVFQTPGAKAYFSQDIQEKGVIIPNPLKDGLPYWQQDRAQKYVVSTCRLEKQKNIGMLLRAFRSFHQQFPDYRLKVCGAGPQMEELQNLAAELGIQEAVDFLGFRKDVYEIVAQGSIFALSSNFEGLSNSMLEALAIGIPTVCTDCPPGGAAQFIVDGENGMLVPVNDADAMSRALCAIASDDAFARKLSQNAVAVRDRLNREKIMEAWKALL